MTYLGPRYQIQATIDSTGHGIWSVHMWDEFGRERWYFIEAKDEQTAWSRAHDRFLDEVGEPPRVIGHPEGEA